MNGYHRIIIKDSIFAVLWKKFLRDIYLKEKAEIFSRIELWGFLVGMFGSLNSARKLITMPVLAITQN